MYYILFKVLFLLAMPVKNPARLPISSECRAITIHIPPIKESRLPLVNGDCEMGGNNPHVTGYARVKRQKNYLLVEYEITITESRPDYTTFSRKGEKKVYINDLESPECRFGLLNYEYGEFDGHAGNNVHYPVTFPGSNLLEKVVVLSDTKGKDCGRLFAHFYFSPVTISLMPR